MISDVVFGHSTSFPFTYQNDSLSVLRVWSGPNRAPYIAVFHSSRLVLPAASTGNTSMEYFDAFCTVVYIGPTSYSHSWSLMLIESANGQHTRKPKGHLST